MFPLLSSAVQCLAVKKACCFWGRHFGRIKVVPLFPRWKAKLLSSFEQCNRQVQLRHEVSY
jgi:hypothetical protein